MSALVACQCRNLAIKKIPAFLNINVDDTFIKLLLAKSITFGLVEGEQMYSGIDQFVLKDYYNL